MSQRKRILNDNTEKNDDDDNDDDVWLLSYCFHDSIFSAWIHGFTISVPVLILHILQQL